MATDTPFTVRRVMVRWATTTTGPADTRQAILDAAEAEFGRRGFRSTTIGGVAAAAGVSRPLVYRYFGDKETLYRLVVERLLASWHDALVGAATPAAPTTAHRLRAVMAACLEWAGRHSMLRGLLLRDSDLTRRVAGTTLDEGRDRLPALLETLPVAMLDFAVHRTESSQAYNRLVELGRPRSHDLEASYEHPNRELEAWVVDGAVAPGLPDPDPAKAGQPGSPGDEAAQTQRQQAIVATLETYSRQVAKARAAVSVGTRYQPVDRSWEVAHLVIKACDDLRRAVGNIEIEVMRL